MTYEEATQATVTQAEAKREIMEAHGHDFETWQEFLAAYGDRDEYRGDDVLGFLGY